MYLLLKVIMLVKQKFYPFKKNIESGSINQEGLIDIRRFVVKLSNKFPPILK